MSKDKKTLDSAPANLFGNMVQKSALVTKDEKQIDKQEQNIDPMELKNFSIRMPVSYKEKLTKHFKDRRGLNLSNGLREVLYTYMREQGLIK